jgi:hypothetical protein
MDTPAPHPNILHLRGLTLADYTPIEDVFDEKVLEAVEKMDDRVSNSPPWDRIPPIFVGVECWPRKTNLRCWSCVCSFDTPPWFAPSFVRSGTLGPVEMGVEGNFCTANCAARYIDDTYPPQTFPEKHWRMRDALCLVYKLITGCQVSHVEAAPPKTERLEFGGTLTANEFWDRLRELDPQYGLRDHRPGTVVPERLRMRPTVWEMYGVAPQQPAETDPPETGPCEAGPTATAQAESGPTGADRPAESGPEERSPAGAGPTEISPSPEVGPAGPDPTGANPAGTGLTELNPTEGVPTELSILCDNGEPLSYEVLDQYLNDLCGF